MPLTRSGAALSLLVRECADAYRDAAPSKPFAAKVDTAELAPTDTDNNGERGLLITLSYESDLVIR